MRYLYSAAIIFAFFSFSFGEVINVPTDYTVIQDAIDNANDYDTIQIDTGTYHEYLTIDKPVRLFGVETAEVQIIGNDTGNVITVTADGAHIAFLTVAGCGPNNDEFEGWNGAIYIENSDSIVIEYCYLRYNQAAGIVLAINSYSIIKNNWITNNNAGIVLYCPDVYVESDTISGPNEYNTIEHNIIKHNTNEGIKFEHGMHLHSFNHVTDNYLYFNGIGIGAIMFNENIVDSNCFHNNSGYGANINMCMGGGGGNTFANNIFIFNNDINCQAFDYWDLQPPNNWNYNYWSDYTGDGSDSYYLETSTDIGNGVPRDNLPLTSYLNSDLDMIPDRFDNCDSIWNSSQSDQDFDFVGNECDNCPEVFNPDQADLNSDGIGDACQDFCGDPNGDKNTNVLDIAFILNYLYAGGPEPYIVWLADMNGDCSVNIIDVTYLITYLYTSGPEPNCPTSWPCK